MPRTCSECARSNFIQETLAHYCRKDGLIIVGPRKTAENCDAYSDKNKDDSMDYIGCYGLLGLAKG